MKVIDYFNPLQIAAIQVILWFSAIFSSLLDNIPYTIAMIPVIQQLAAESEHLSITGERLNLHCSSGGLGMMPPV